MTAPNKYEGLVGRLETVRTLVWPTPDGPVALQWPVKITAENAREAFAAVRVAFGSIERVASSEPPFEEYEAVLSEALASPADGEG